MWIFLTKIYFSIVIINALRNIPTQQTLELKLQYLFQSLTDHLLKQDQSIQINKLSFPTRCLFIFRALQPNAYCGQCHQKSRKKATSISKACTLCSIQQHTVLYVLHSHTVVEIDSKHWAAKLHLVLPKQ